MLPRPLQLERVSAPWQRPIAPSMTLPLRQPVAVEPPGAEPNALPPLPVDSPPGLTLGELEQIALKYNPTLAQASMAVRAAQGGYVQAGLYPNPSIGYAAADVGIEGTAGQQGFVLGQEFVTAGKLRLERNVAGHEVHQAQWGWDMQQWRVLNDVRESYYEVLMAQRMIDVNRELVRIGSKGLETTQKLRDAQEVSEANVLQARIEARVAEVSLHEAQNRHQAAWRRLAGLLGRPMMTPAPLAGDVDGQLPELEWQATVERLWAGSPELARAWAGVRRAECNLVLQRAERVPNLEVEVGAKWDPTTEETLADVGVALALPLFNRNQGNITKAHAELIGARNEVRRVELDLRDRLVAAFEQYANARRNVETYKTSILPDAQKSRDMISAHYPDQFDYLTLLTAQRTYFAVSLEYLKSLGELWASSIGIDGLLLTGGLESAGE